MHKIYLLFLILLLTSCNSVKVSQRNINNGRYDSAIELSIRKLRRDKYHKKNEPHIILLQRAFNKAVKHNSSEIYSLKQQQTFKNLERIIDLYKLMNQRQEKIKPLLPLRLQNSKKQVLFKIVNYQENILNSTNNLINYLYDNSVQKLKYNQLNKLEYREVYDNLTYIDKLRPNFKDVSNLINEVHHKGTNHIYIKIKNNTQQVIPKRLENDLLAIDTFGLDNFWTIYYNNPDSKIKFDYVMDFIFKRIDISPERIKENSYVKEKIIKENVFVTDSLGNKTEAITERKVTAEFFEVKQLKTCSIVADVYVYDNMSKQLVETYPLQSNFIFEHAYGNYKGDRRALDNIFLEIINAREVRFPTNEQMIYDAGNELKHKFKSSIQGFNN